MLAPLSPNSAARGRSIVRRLLCCALLPLFLGAPIHARAGDGFLGIDHELDLDQRGIWARKYQVALEYGVIATEIGGSLWLGNDDELGHTLWQTIDATAISSIAAEGLKFKPGALANRCHCRMGIGIGGRLLGDDAQYPAFGADFAARPVGGLL
jgi:hypothetical protein